MKRTNDDVIRILRFVLYLLATLAVLIIGLGAYLLYTPDPDSASLAGTLTKGTIEAGGMNRTYQAYVPKDLPKGAALIFMLHGAGQDAQEIRTETGYAFERLADRQGFEVVYPEGVDGWWNSCVAIDDSEANRRDIDDVGFLAALSDKLVGESGIDPHRLYAVGFSNGGDMAIRLVLEAPTHYRAVAPLAANIPAPENFKCRSPLPGGSSVFLMHGTADRLVPFEGGEGSLFGFYRSGRVLSAVETGQYFAGLNGIPGAPAITRGKTADGFSVERSVWRGSAPHEVELFAIEGAGHVIPQPYYRARRLLGASPADPDAAVLIWDFFSRQK